MSDEVIKPPATSKDNLGPKLRYVGTKTRVEFTGSFLKQDKITYTHGAIVNIYIVHEKTKNNAISSYPPLENCLLGPVKLTKDPAINKYKYSGYGIRFDRKGKFSFGNGFGKNVIISGADMSSSVHVDN